MLGTGCDAKVLLGSTPPRFTSLSAARKSYHPALPAGFFFGWWITIVQWDMLRELTNMVNAEVKIGQELVKCSR